MEYTSTSMKEVIGRIIRKTGLQESEYLISMDEWIPEAMGQMKTKVQLQPTWQDVDIHFHIGAMPCGLIHISGVEWHGQRLEYGNSQRTVGAPYQRPVPGSSEIVVPTPFLTVPYKRETPDGAYIYDSTAIPQPRCTTWEACSQLPLCKQWYTTSLNIIQTSFADGKVRVHYKTVPHDEEGYPLIPDNENYKEAIYWYVRGCMIGAGWDDKVFSFNQCDAKFELHAGRAMAQIRYPSVDQMEMKVNASTRFIPPVDYFSSFGSTPYEEPYYGAPPYGVI